MLVLFSINVHDTNRPEMTFAVDWALQTNDLSTHDTEQMAGMLDFSIVPDLGLEPAYHDK